MILFDKYLPPCLERLRSEFKTITPVPEVTAIQTVLSLLECFLTPKNVPPDSPREQYELFFVFACIWAFGGALFQDQVQPQHCPAPATPLCTPSCAWALSVSVLSSSWWITAHNSASGGWGNLKPSSFLVRGQFSTITFIQKRRLSIPGMKECQSLSSTLTSPCRYFPQVLCLYGLFGCHSSLPLSNAWSITRVWSGSTYQTQINLQLQRVSQSSCDYCLSAKCPLALNLCFLQWHLVGVTQAVREKSEELWLCGSSRNCPCCSV